MKRKMFDLALGLAAFGLLALARNARADDPVAMETCCPDGCCHKVCRPVPDVKKVPKRVYSSGCEDFCLQKCGLFGCLGGHKHCECEGCCAGRCGHVRTRKYLILKIQEKEECVTKCVVEQQACGVTCDHAACPAQVISGPQVPVETVVITETPTATVSVPQPQR